MPKAPSVKQEATDNAPSPYSKIPSPSGSPSKPKERSPKKTNIPPIEPVDDMANKKYQIMLMIFEAAKSLRADDIAEKVRRLRPVLNNVVRGRADDQSATKGGTDPSSSKKSPSGRST